MIHSKSITLMGLWHQLKQREKRINIQLKRFLS